MAKWQCDSNVMKSTRTLLCTCSCVCVCTFINYTMTESGKKLRSPIEDIHSVWLVRVCNSIRLSVVACCLLSLSCIRQGCLTIIARPCLTKLCFCFMKILWAQRELITFDMFGCTRFSSLSLSLSHSVCFAAFPFSALQPIIARLIRFNAGFLVVEHNRHYSVARRTTICQLILIHKCSIPTKQSYTNTVSRWSLGLCLRLCRSEQRKYTSWT